MSLLDCDWTKDAIISDLCKAFLPKFTILAESFYVTAAVSAAVWFYYVLRGLSLRPDYDTYPALLEVNTLNDS